ncbi:MAG: hypothetical protein OCC45_10450 [Desulfotalea sp.]
MLLLNEFRVPGHNLKVTGSMAFRAEDIAGETSGTERAEKGISPKVLRVSLAIPFNKPDALRDLIKTAEAKDDKGEGVIYMITHPTANVAGVRQVVFSENISWPEAESLQQWEISFALQEHLSNPERAEKRQTSAPKTSNASKHADVLDKVRSLGLGGR